MNTDREVRNDKAMFDAYVSLRKIAQKYQLEGELAIPRVVFVGETSSGKSMLVQNFLRFPCAFSQSDVGTRCPILYRLRYNPTLGDDVILVKQPTGIRRAEDLSEHLRDVMQQIEREEGFRLEEYLVHIESNQYRDFEILDVPGLIGGSHDSQHLLAVERITEHYVRDPTFLIVQLKEATQIGVNSTGTKRIRDFCVMDPAPRGSPLPPRDDYENFTITIQTKFDLFMEGHRDGSHANEDMDKLLEHFNQRALFVSMIYDVYNFGKHTYSENLQYISALPELERQRVDKWINDMNKFSQESRKNYDKFDEARFRPLIGINLVRGFIQDMWVKAFRSAIPKIQQVLTELLQEQTLRYDTIHNMVKEKDLNTIRSSYIKYIERFRSILPQYITYRAEINNQFEYDKYSRTYKQIEEEYNQWPRKQSLTWSAYKTAEQLTTEPSDRRLYSLPLRYIGARHFERLRQVFFYMILTYQPATREQGWFETSQSLLYGTTADNENLEKGVRELLYTHIRETFAIGICWLTQMYSFFIDHFEQHVTSVLLKPDGEFAHLAMGHTKFLNYVSLEYHRITRQFIRNAVAASKHARYAKMVYASHGIAHFLRALVESFPPTIKNTHSQDSSTSNKNPHRLIYDSEVFLPENRNSETGNYIPATRNAIHELYVAVRGLLLHDITTNFFANIVIKIQEYNSINIPNALKDRIRRMSNKQVGNMYHINLHENLKELQTIHEKLKLLEQACDDIERATRLFDNEIIFNTNENKQETKTSYSEKRERIHQELINKLYDVKLKKDADNDIQLNSNDESDSNNDHDDDGDDKEELKLLDDDPWQCQKNLLKFFGKHDLDDLKDSFLEGDDFNINKNIKVLQRQRSLSLSTEGKTNVTTTNSQLRQDLTKSNISSSSDDFIEGKKQSETIASSVSDLPNTITNSPKLNHDEKSRTKWHHNLMPKKT